MLTGKCKEAFLKAVLNEADHKTMVEVEACLFVGDIRSIWGWLLWFFDSVGIYISVNGRPKGDFRNYINNTMISPDYETRQQAQTEAVKKVNEIFNQEA